MITCGSFGQLKSNKSDNSLKCGIPRTLAYPWWKNAVISSSSYSFTAAGPWKSSWKKPSS